MSQLVNESNNDSNDLFPISQDNNVHTPKRKRIDSDSIFHGTTVGSAVKRKFPGPAGILPDDEVESISNEQICSQQTYSVFHEGPWKEMSKDFKITNMLYLYDKFNITWIKKEASANNFIKEKAPFLAAILHSVEISEGSRQKTVNIVLKDLTGTIQGTIDYSLYQQHANILISGSVLVIVNFGVLSCTCDKCDNHHLTVTSKNLCILYTTSKKVLLNKVEPEEILKNYCKRKKELDNERKNDTLKLSLTRNNPASVIYNRCFSKNYLISPRSFPKSGIGNPTYNFTRSVNSVSQFNLPLCKTLSPKPQVENILNTSMPSPRKSFNFKRINISRNSADADNNLNTSSENSLNSGSVKDHRNEEKKMCKDMLEGIDINCLFDDF